MSRDLKNDYSAPACLRIKTLVRNPCVLERLFVSELLRQTIKPTGEKVLISKQQAERLAASS